jgi:hypothetical protein
MLRIQRTTMAMQLLCCSTDVAYQLVCASNRMVAWPKAAMAAACITAAA